MHYVYFLELSNHNIYVGFSSNLKQRFKAHNDGKVPATAGFLPAKLKSYAELRLHPVDFLYIRIEFILAKLKTYFGLARISEFSITKEQWLEWHKIELRQTLNELVHNIKQTE
jgi:hypothetical protein